LGKFCLLRSFYPVEEVILTILRLDFNDFGGFSKTERSSIHKCHVGVPGNEAADDAAKEALNEKTHHTETYPSQDLIACIKEKYEQEQQEKWENSTTTTKKCKPQHIINTNSKTMTRREHKPLTHWIYQSHSFCSDGQ
jgi:hypothetical protein